MHGSVSNLILESLIQRKDFSQSVLPFLKAEYFENIEEQTIFLKIKRYTEEYFALPTLEVLAIDLNNDPNVQQNVINFFVELSETIETIDKPLEWLIDVSEQFCKDRALFIALEQSIKIAKNIEDSNGLSRGSLPKIFEDALAVSFDTFVGHDYIENSDDRYEFYHEAENKLKFNLTEMNNVTGGGLPDKTLNVVMGPSGSGKTLILCDWSASWVSLGYKVLYITMEMSEERIAQRIDANLMNVDVDQIEKMDKNTFDANIKRIKKSTVGEFVVKEYGTGSANTGHFRYLVNELKEKKGFIPDVIVVDYINICSSSRVKNNIANSYTIVKSIAEEFRGLGVELNLPIVTATQSGRSSFGSNDISAIDVSESIGLIQTADMVIGIITNEDLDKQGIVLLKTVKNSRYGVSDTIHKIGINRARMKLFDVQGGLDDEISTIQTITPTETKDKFKNFKL